MLDVLGTGLLLGGDDPVYIAEQLLAVESALAGVLVLQVRLLFDKQLARFVNLVLLQLLIPNLLFLLQRKFDPFCRFGRRQLYLGF